MSHAWEKFYEAVRSLASWGSIQKRLANTYICYLAQLESSSLPKEIQSDFDDFRNKLTDNQPFGEEDAVQAKIDKMTDQDAFEYAERIIDMYEYIVRREGPL
jgi:hypothetical protein